MQAIQWSDDAGDTVDGHWQSERAQVIPFPSAIADDRTDDISLPNFPTKCSARVSRTLH